VLEGVVVRSTGSWHEVDLGKETVSCRVPGRFRLEDRDTTNPLAVGDRVVIQLEEDGTGRVESVLPRTNVLTRRAAGRRVGLEHVIAANVDFAWVVQSVHLPRFNAGFVDRFMVAAERDEIPAGVILNKMDLAGPDYEDTLAPIMRVYESIGYPVLLSSAIERTGISQLKSEWMNKTSVLAGPSGVGKSSLLNAVDPSLNLKEDT
jgi:ribosome biogenesis GTPase